MKQQIILQTTNDIGEAFFIHPAGSLRSVKPLGYPLKPAPRPIIDLMFDMVQKHLHFAEHSPILKPLLVVKTADRTFPNNMTA